MKLRAALLVHSVALWAGVNAQNDTFNAQRVAPVPANECPQAGYITVTQVNKVTETTTVTQNNAAATVTTCPQGEKIAPEGAGYGYGYGTTTTVTATLPCTKATTVTSYQNCIPVSSFSQSDGFEPSDKLRYKETNPRQSPSYGYRRRQLDFGKGPKPPYCSTVTEKCKTTPTVTITNTKVSSVTLVSLLMGPYA